MSEKDFDDLQLRMSELETKFEQMTDVLVSMNDNISRMIDLLEMHQQKLEEHHSLQGESKKIDLLERHCQKLEEYQQSKGE